MGKTARLTLAHGKPLLTGRVVPQAVAPPAAPINVALPPNRQSNSVRRIQIVPYLQLSRQSPSKNSRTTHLGGGAIDSPDDEGKDESPTGGGGTTGGTTFECW